MLHFCSSCGEMGFVPDDEEFCIGCIAEKRLESYNKKPAVSKEEIKPRKKKEAIVCKCKGCRACRDNRYELRESDGLCPSCCEESRLFGNAWAVANGKRKRASFGCKLCYSNQSDLDKNRHCYSCSNDLRLFGLQYAESQAKKRMCKCMEK